MHSLVQGVVENSFPLLLASLHVHDLEIELEFEKDEQAHEVDELAAADKDQRRSRYAHALRLTPGIHLMMNEYRAPSGIGTGGRKL